MDELIMISKTRDHVCPIRTNKRLIELKKLKFDELEKIVQRHDIKKYHLTHTGILTREYLINGIISHENMLLGKKQTEIIIDSKSYFIETISKFILITKKNADNKEIYNIKNNLCSPTSSTEISYSEKTLFSFCNHILQKSTNWYDDMKICRKAILFIESYHLYLKIKLLLYVFNENEINDIIRNICLIYFERTLLGVYNVRCRFE